MLLILLVCFIHVSCLLMPTSGIFRGEAVLLLNITGL